MLAVVSIDFLKLMKCHQLIFRPIILQISSVMIFQSQHQRNPINHRLNARYQSQSIDLDPIPEGENIRHRHPYSLEKVCPPIKQTFPVYIDYSTGSCHQVETNLDIDRRTQKIAQRVAEFFALIKDNPSNR